MKRKRTYKILIAVIMAICISLIAPGQHLKKDTNAAVVEVVALSAATLLVMYLASVGVSYVFSGMSSAEAKTYIGGKWEEWKTHTGANPNITPNGGWKWGKLGQIFIGGALGAAFAQFTLWLLGDGTESEIGDNEFVTVDAVTSSNMNVINYSGSYNAGTGNITSASSLPGELYNELRNVSGKYSTDTIEDGEIVNYASNVYSLATANTTYTNIRVYVDDVAVGTNYRVRGGSAEDRYRTFTVAYNEYNDDLVMLGRYGQTNSGIRIRTLKSNYLYEPIEDSSIAIKTGALDIPDVSAEDEDAAVVVKNPPGASTVELDEDGVPIPIEDEGIWEKIWSMIQENSAADVVYNPTYNITYDYGDVVTINDTTYDTPLTSEEEDELNQVVQPAWADFRAEDVPGFVNDVIAYFRDNNIWDNLKHKFPFSLPYDAYLIASGFFDTSYDVMEELPISGGSNRRLLKSANEPIYQINIPTWDNGSYTLTMDFTILDPWRPLFRAIVGILFTVLLITGV